MENLNRKAFWKSLIVSTLFLTLPYRVFAWSTQQSANAFCEGDKAYISATFKNEEPSGDNYSMLVTPTDNQSGISGSTVELSSGEEYTWSIPSGLSQLSNGKVEFYLEWVSGGNQTDKVSASYAATPLCFEEPEDVCLNLEGIQETTPPGYVNNDGICEPEVPQCNNCGGGEPKDEIKNFSIDLNKKVRLEGTDSWKDKVTDVDSEDTIEWRMKVTNTGTTELKDLKMTDYLPDELERVGGSGLTEYFSDLGVDAEKTFIIKAKVKPQYLNEDRCVVNRAKVEQDKVKKAEDSASVCFGEVAISELPETGPSATWVLCLAGMLCMFYGLRFRYQLSR